MLFTTATFWAFFALVIALIHWNGRAIRSIDFQNTILCTSSYFFYGYWDWRFLGLILGVTTHTYLLGRLSFNSPKYRGIYLSISIFLNMLILGYFKYFNFFASEFVASFGFGGEDLFGKVILPVGISFYIFQSLTYVIDIYLGKLHPEKKFLNYCTYIAFFPQLVAGPIERASSLLPQFRSLKSINLENFYTGLKICIIGLFLKVFIADNVGDSVDAIFFEYEQFNGGTLFLGAIYFTIQIYGDFCGYSLIAIGVAKIMGFNLMRNFDSPYFSTSIQDFWRRWHISLSTFFRDYIYIPLGGNRVSSIAVNRNLVTTFFLSGLWHGANWTFMFWGFLHGILLICQKTIQFNINKFAGWIATMSFVILLWIMFRSETIYDFFRYTHNMFSDPSVPGKFRSDMIFIFYFIVVDIILLKYKEQGTVWFQSKLIEGFIIALMFVLIISTIFDTNPNFIYFQF
jgi:alginate O-acetyltransferase complex protein AlgI